MGTQKKEKDKGKKQLPEPLATQRDYVICGADMNYHTNTQVSASHYMPLGVDNSWDFESFSDNFQIVVNSLTDERLEFDMIGIDPAIANALRRVMIAEVDTVAIEHVFIINNTSIIQDEVLAHRLGMVPLAIDPELLERRSPEEAPTERNTVVFKLDVTAHSNNAGGVTNGKVLSSALQWQPQGSELQAETSVRFASSQDVVFAGHPAPRAVHEDILLARLRPGQGIELEAHCIVGAGREHAKWSPVATAWYRLHPEVVLLQPVVGEAARELAELAPGLFLLEDGPGGEQRAKVTSARQYEHLLEKVRRLGEHDHWRKVVQVRKRKDHFIFTVEGTGALRPEVVFKRALRVLADKCSTLKQRL